MKLNRRELLQWASLSVVSGCGRQAAEPEPFAHEFVPHVVGANTAITGWGFFDAVELLSEIGFQTIEVQNLVGRLEPTAGAFPGFQLDQISGEEKERILASLRPFECVTVHLPYPASMPYINPDAEDAVAQLELALEAARFVGASVAVLHPQPSGADLNANWATAVERIRKWGSIAADYGFQLACETSAPKSLPDLVRFIDEINHENVGVTLDVGHQSGFEELAGIPPEERAAPHAIKAYNDLNVDCCGSGAKAARGECWF